MACEDENLTCEDQKLGDSQLFRKLFRKIGDCFYLAITGQVSLSAPEEDAVITTDIITSNGSGNIPSVGADNVLIETDADFAGSINGKTRQPNRIYSFRHGFGKPLPNIPYNKTAGSITYDIIS